MNKEKAHFHEFRNHKKYNYLVTCNICGFAIPLKHLNYAIKHGAKDLRNVNKKTI